MAEVMAPEAAAFAGQPRMFDVVEAIASSDMPLFGRTVLIVEDEMLVLMDAEDMLFELGCRSVVMAASVAEALSLVRTERLDAALLDVNLNGDRSFAIADALASNGIPFAFATGYGAHGLRVADGDRPVLTKPYRIGDLARAMSSLLGR
ncbi:MAG: response regulator [Caulobacter sp.]|nr:response regulator [Caulobacter sp.]